MLCVEMGRQCWEDMEFMAALRQSTQEREWWQWLATYALKTLCKGTFADIFWHSRCRISRQPVFFNTLMNHIFAGKTALPKQWRTDEFITTWFIKDLKRPVSSSFKGCRVGRLDCCSKYPTYLVIFCLYHPLVIAPNFWTFFYLFYSFFYLSHSCSLLPALCLDLFTACKLLVGNWLHY